MKAKQLNNKRAFTLAESLLATVILSMAAAAILLPFTAGLQMQDQSKRQAIATSLAGNMLKEILSRDYDDIIAAYNGLTESAGTVTDSAGNTLQGDIYKPFSREVSCQQVFMPQQQGSADAPFISVTVQVYWDSQEMAKLTSLKAK